MVLDLLVDEIQEVPVLMLDFRRVEVLIKQLDLVHLLRLDVVLRSRPMLENPKALVLHQNLIFCLGYGVFRFLFPQF